MSNFYMNVSKMLDRYGTDIKVWSTKIIPKAKRVAGVLKPADLSAVTPDLRHEPVLPWSSNSAGLVTYLNGGASLDVDLLWLSSGNYPKNSIVEIPTQGGKYRVVGIANYQDYSNLIVYQLKGDDAHSDRGY